MERPQRFSLKNLFILISFALIFFSCRKDEVVSPLGRIRLAIPEKILSLDPAQADDYYSATETSKTYEGLLRYDYVARPYRLVPAIAEKMPEVSADGKTIRIQLKSKIYFQDDPCFKKTGENSEGKGRTVTSADFIYSILRIADPKKNSPLWRSLDGKIAGLNDWRMLALSFGKADYSKSIEGLRAVDALTLEIRLTEPNRPFLNLLALPVTYVVPKEADDYYGQRIQKNPVGTGPYRLNREASDLNSLLIWEANPGYRIEQVPVTESGFAANQHAPLIPRIEVRVVKDESERWRMFMSSELDLIDLPKGEAKEVLTSGKDLLPTYQRKGYRLYKTPSFALAYQAFNFLNPVLGKSKGVRQALSLTVQPESLIDLLYYGFASPASVPIPPGLFTFAKPLNSPYRRFDLARARALIRDAGYLEGEGFPALDYLDYGSASSSGVSPLADFLKKSLQAINVNLVVRSAEWETYLKLIRSHGAAIWSGVWRAEYPDPEAFFQAFYSRNISSGANESAFKNAEYDALYEKLMKEPGGPALEPIYRKLTEILIEECPWIWEIHPMHFTLVQPWVRNFVPHEFDGSSIRFWKVEPR